MTKFFYVDKQSYGLCLRCTRNEELWIVAELLPGSDLTGFLCNYCLGELAVAAGYMLREEHNIEEEKLHNIIREQEAQIEIIPNLLEGLTSNVNDLISNFVTDLAGVTVSNISVQPESDSADATSVKRKPRRPSNTDSAIKVAPSAVYEPISK